MGYEGFSVRADVLVQDPGTNFLDHLFILWWVLVDALRVSSIGFPEFEMLP